ncbi:MAG: Mov34/MPN/PAD-1 family protein [Firmicutes bacterium]|nr:Mov34/MPN/PAD-1 family protein [Bacillota bacterium]
MLRDISIIFPKPPKPPIPPCLRITDEVADQIEATIGSLPAETGGFLGSSNGNTIDHFYFDHTAETSAATYTPDISAVNRKLQEWDESGVHLIGNVHSHPEGYTHPSGADIKYAQRIMDALDLPEFYILIVQPEYERRPVTC